MSTEIHPAPTEFTAQEIAADPLLHFFHYAHLPPKLQATSRNFFLLAHWLVRSVPRSAERTVALRKLLESKDAAVRANLPPPGTEKRCQHATIFAEWDHANAGPMKTGKCTGCGEMVPTKDYAQSAGRAQGFLTRILRDEGDMLGETREVGGHDEREEPLDFTR